MNVCLDSSILLRVLLGDGAPLPRWDEFEQPFTSRLTLIEVTRVIDRVRLGSQMNDEEFSRLANMAGRSHQGLQMVPLVEEVLERAEQPMQTAVGTLDAIHLASAVALRIRQAPDLVFATHDRQQGIGARALGFDVIGVEL